MPFLALLARRFWREAALIGAAVLFLAASRTALHYRDLWQSEVANDNARLKWEQAERQRYQEAWSAVAPALAALAAQVDTLSRRTPRTITRVVTALDTIQLPSEVRVQIDTLIRDCETCLRTVSAYRDTVGVLRALLAEKPLTVTKVVEVREPWVRRRLACGPHVGLTKEGLRPSAGCTFDVFP